MISKNLSTDFGKRETNRSHQLHVETQSPDDESGLLLFTVVGVVTVSSWA